MTTANALIADAYLQTGIIPQEADQIQPYLIAQGLTLLNDIIIEWGGQTSKIPYNNPPIKFKFTPNKTSYTFGLASSNDIRVSPIIEVITFTFFLNTPSNSIVYAIQQISEFQYSQIVTRKNSSYPSQFLLRLYPDYSEIIIQNVPSSNFDAEIIGKQRLNTVDLYTDLGTQFPDNFLLCLKYRLMLDMADANGLELSQNFINKYNKTMDNMMGSNKTDLTINNSETMSRNNMFGNFYFGNPF